MNYEFIEVVREQTLTVITIDRPQVRNALNTAAHFELARAFDAFDQDPAQHVAILTGRGRDAFCAGHDLKQGPGGDIPMPPTGFGGITERFDLGKPVIAAVNGICMGGGFEIALACDIIIASAAARFALRLPRLIGLKQALGMLLTGRHVMACEGQRLGFVNEVTEGDALDIARRWAAYIQECSPAALRATKLTATDGLDLPLRDAFAAIKSHPAVRAMWESPDSIEGPQAFADRRLPRWAAS